MNTNAKSQSKNNTNYSNSNKMMTETMNSNNHFNQWYALL